MRDLVAGLVPDASLASLSGFSLKFLAILALLLVVSRALAFAIRPDVAVSASESWWLCWAWMGFLLTVASAAAWSLDVRDTGWLRRPVVLVAGVASALMLFFLRFLVTRLRETGWAWRGSVIALALAVTTWVVLFGFGVLGETLTWSVISLSVTTVAGVVLFGTGLGARLRVRVTVRRPSGDVDIAWSAYLRQRVATMGHHRARGFNAPAGTDVSALPDQAMTALPGQYGKLAGALIAFGQTLAAIAPWRANVVIVDSATATVELTRNGALKAETLVFRTDLGLAPDAGGTTTDASAVPHELLTASAAFVLIRLAESHPMLRIGLYGAKRWRSLATQVLAGTPPLSADPQQAEQLYATAIQVDPGNLAARLGYVDQRFGQGTPDTDMSLALIARLENIGGRLSRRQSELGPAGFMREYGRLHMRILYSLVTARINYTLTASTDESHQRLRAYGELDRLDDVLQKALASKEPDTKEFAEAMRLRVPIVRAQLEHTQADIDECDLTPEGYYLLACADVEQEQFPQALTRLEMAAGLTRLRQEMRFDPSFSGLRRDKTHSPGLVAMLERPSLSELDAFREHAHRLEMNGIRFPEQLLSRTEGADGGELAKALHVPLSTLHWMCEVCRLVTTSPDPVQAMAWTNLLTQDGIDTRAALASLDRNVGEKQRLLRRSATVHAEPLTAERLQNWVTASRHRAPAPGRQTYSAGTDWNDGGTTIILATARWTRSGPSS